MQNFARRFALLSHALKNAFGLVSRPCYWIVTRTRPVPPNFASFANALNVYNFNRNDLITIRVLLFSLFSILGV